MTEWIHHAPTVLSDADAAADLAGLPRPDCGAPQYAGEANTEELLLASKQPDALHLADALEKSMQYPLHGKAADMLRQRAAAELRRLAAENERLRAAYWKMRNAAAGYSNYCEESASTRRCEKDYNEAEAMFRALSAAMKEQP